MNFTDLYNFLLSQSTNEFLVGGVVTVLLSGFLYLLRSIPSRIFLFLRRLLTLEFTVTTRNDNYDDVLKELYLHRVKFFSRNYTADVKGSNLSPGYGSSFGYKRVELNGKKKTIFFTFQRNMLENKMKMEEETGVTFFTRSTEFMQKFIDDCQVSKNESVIKVITHDADYWDNGKEKLKRSLDTVFVNGNTKESIVEKIDWFLNNREWYTKRGIPYKLCILLHGEPGTGKTSLIFAMASKFGFNIRFISKLSYFKELIGYINKEDFVVIEDIDCLGDIDRDTEEKVVQAPMVPINTTIHDLLNSIDGMVTPDGMILFITTNHLDKIDDAIIRKGRVDELIEIEKLNFEEFSRMYRVFYDAECPEAFAKIYKPLTGAVIQDIFRNNRTKEEALEGIKKWQKTRVKKTFS